ncbi:uncharacterized protein LOC143908508 isoform X2 [Temnothorax americanus]|uniref:uncharacterized protein LOC143908508 isoform X2 n=1 Tax=Temnothorax americanus TaxID=1964332 RepID=UPI004068C5C4
MLVAPYKYPQLSKLAVPTKLLHDATNNEAVDPLGESSSHLVGSVINSVHCDKATPVKSPVPIEVSNHHTEKDSADVSSKSLNTPSCLMYSTAYFGRWTLTAMEEADTIMKTPTSDPHTEIDKPIKHFLYKSTFLLL